jgi:UrcA family protein
MRKRLALAAAVLPLLGLPLTAAARDWDRESRLIRVETEAFDLATPAGRDELARRIARAVNRICGSDGWCREEAWASTDAQVAWAIDRDVRIRVLAAEREAQLRQCEWDDCLPPRAPEDYSPPPPPPSPPPAPAYYAPPLGAGRTVVTRVTVRIVHSGAPPTILTYCR